MPLNDDYKREICQLWIVARYYFDKANEYYSQISETQLSLTVKEISEKFKIANESKLGNEIVAMKDLILASANFSSCSVRLYSIDEKQNSTSFQSYRNRIWISDNSIEKMNNSSCVKTAYDREKVNLTHIVLRHMVAHSETESPDYKKAYNILYSDYMTYTIPFIKDKLSNIIVRIENDIDDAIKNIKDFRLCANRVAGGF